MIRAVHFRTPDGDHRIGRLEDGRVVDAGAAGAAGFVPAPAAWEALASAQGTAFAVDAVDLRAPVLPGKVVCVGLNYRDHAEETGAPVPERPLLFAKFPSSVVGPYDTVRIGPESDQTDYEAELALVIGQRASRVTRDEALAAIGGYTAMNDVSARAVQLGDGQWVRGKSFDTFAPLGPSIVAPDGVAWDALAVRCRIGGELLQDGHTRDLIFDVGEIVRFVAERITLLPGDVIATGTPAGVGLGRAPQRWLRPGEIVEVEVGDAGTLRNPVAEL